MSNIIEWPNKPPSDEDVLSIELNLVTSDILYDKIYQEFQVGNGYSPSLEKTLEWYLGGIIEENIDMIQIASPGHDAILSIVD